MKKLLLAVAAVLGLAACNNANQSGNLTVSGLDTVKFDTVINGDSVKLYTLKNDKGMEVCITNYGGRVVSLVVPDKENKPTDVVLGYDNIAQYADTVNSPSDYGSSVGRYANRIADSKITINDTVYNLKPNDTPNCLHGGGNSGWMHKVLEVVEVTNNSIKMKLEAADGENGFPGNVVAYTTYTITDDNTLDIVWEAETDKETVINMTNHNYYNLNGDPENVGTDMVLYLNADNWTPATEAYIPTGEIAPVEGTPMDFREPHAIADSIVNAKFAQMKNSNGIGYDHNWCLNTYKDGKGDDTTVCASLYSPKTGIFMEMYTNEPGVQCYTGNFQGENKELVCKGGKKYPPHVSVCLESQKYPNSPNVKGWPSPFVKPGEKYYSHAAYKFSIK
ncbi:MAG: galactose mutarotase [Bacteroidaceae bacterium]|nr:galactose mutarotase [Bacteroidaceae bacterium]